MMLAAGPGRKTNRLLAVLTALACLPNTASAAMTYVSVGEKIMEVACAIYKVFLDIAGALASLVFLIAAIKWVMSQGDPEARVNQRETMVHAIVGLLILLVVKTVVLAVAGVTNVPNECKW